MFLAVARESVQPVYTPLADRMRPRTLEHFFGQQHILGKSGNKSSALRQSIETGDADWEANLVASHHKLHLMEKRMASGDTSEKETWKRYDWQFHLALIQACNSKNLLSLHSTLFNKYLRYQLLVLTHRGEVAVEEHKQMLQMALDRNAKGAADLLKTHIENGLKHTLDAMKI